jgi:lipopolysaccharide assembly outer membrane protein LptD (OstA)
MKYFSNKYWRQPPKRWPLLLFVGIFLCAIKSYAPAQDNGVLSQPALADEPFSADSLSSFAGLPDSLQSAPARTWDLSGDDTSRTAIRYMSNTLEYDVNKSLIRLSGQAQVRYRDIKVVGDTIEFDTKRQMLTVRKDPVLYDRSDSIYGDRMVYDFKGRRGWIYNGRTKFDRGRYWGKKIRQVDDRTLNVDNGRYTTCDADTPHYYFWSRRMRIYLDDKIVTQPVVLCFSDVPVMAIPFWFFPLRKDRHSGFMVPRFGSSAYEGVFAKNIAYYQVINDQADATISMDMLEKVGWRGNFEARYINPGKLSSNLNFSYLEDKAPLRKRWTLTGTYQQNLGKRTAIIGNGNFVSDKSYNRDFSENLEERLNRNLHSYLSFYHSWTRASVNAALDHYDNLDAQTTSSRLPDMSFNLYQKELIPGFLNISGKSQALVYRRSDSLNVNLREGWDNRAELGSNLKLLKWISINPRLSLMGTWFDKDRYGDRSVWRWLYSGGISASTTLYGILPLKIGPLQGFRHVLQPSLSYSYAPEIDQSRFETFGSIGNLYRQSSMNISVNNTFQTRYPKGKDLAKLDLASVSLGASYNYLNTDKKWSNISLSANLLPSNRYFSCRLSSYYDPYLWRPENTNLYMNLRFSGNWLGKKQILPDTLSGDTSRAFSKSNSELPDSMKVETNDSLKAGVPENDTLSGKEIKPRTINGLPWSFNLSYDQSWSRNYGNSNLQGSLDFNITKNWKVSYGKYYNLKAGEMVSESYSVYRDLHCWEARFSSSRSGVYWSFEFRVNLKAIPELKIHIPKSGTSAY